MKNELTPGIIDSMINRKNITYDLFQKFASNLETKRNAFMVYKL